MPSELEAFLGLGKVTRSFAYYIFVQFSGVSRSIAHAVPSRQHEWFVSSMNGMRCEMLCRVDTLPLEVCLPERQVFIQPFGIWEHVGGHATVPFLPCDYAFCRWAKIDCL